MQRPILAGMFLAFAMATLPPYFATAERRLPAATTLQTEPEVARAASLAALGKVWGFLKYHHPAIAGGTLDWDSAGAAAIEQALGARTRAVHAAVIRVLIDAAGSVPLCDRCDEPPADAQWLNHDDSWLYDATIDDESRRQLLHVRANRHIGSGRWHAFPTSTLSLAEDTAYMEPLHPARSHRVLALFRYWNAVHYYFAYGYINDGDWGAVLLEFVPRMLDAVDVQAYHLAALELTARVRDTHVTTTSAVLDSFFGSHVPEFEAQSIEGRIVVVPTGTSPAVPQASAAGELRVGDVITHVDGTAVAERRAQLAPHVAAGNSATFERNLVRLVLRTRSDTAIYTIDRSGVVLDVRVAMAPLPPPPASMPLNPPLEPVAETVRLLPDRIAYVDLGGIERTQVDSAIALVRGASGIVFDVRRRPRGTAFDFAAFLYPVPRDFALLTVPDSTRPGVFLRYGPLAAGPQQGSNETYRGRIAILADERTQSHGEFTVMALQPAPESRVIGSRTAGANGNVVAVFLPGGIRTLFSGIGVYYPDGRQTQRTGIVPDIEARPTLAGIRAGRDEVLERAIEYIRTGG